MKTYYYNFAINYDEDDCCIFGVKQPLKKGDIAVVCPSGYSQLFIAEVIEPVTDLYALTHCGGEEVENVIQVVDTTEWLAKQKALVERLQIEKIMDKKMAELKTLDTLKKFADKDAEFKDLFDKYQKTFSTKATEDNVSIDEID